MGFDLSGANPKRKSEEPNPDVDFSKWQDWLVDNPGVYFRNNVWWWRATWDYICDVCSDILSQKDIHGGNYNEGHLITASKALSIARRLDKLIKKGDVNSYEISYKDWMEKTNNKNYPFSEGNVKEFSRFARASGGFYIC